MVARGKKNPLAQEGQRRARIRAGEENGESVQHVFVSEQEVQNRPLLILKHRIEKLLEACFF